MKASKDNVKVGDTLIFRCAEYADRVDMFDGQVQLVQKTGVDVIYLSGYRSRNDFIPWDDILAKVDKSKPHIELANTPYFGQFVEYN